jgi:hypothetical protein
MKQCAWLGFLAMLLMGNLGGSAPLEARKPAKGLVRAFGQSSFIERFEGQKRAGAIVIGDGGTYLGLYVFDRWGNCVARDDFTGSSAGRDDLAVEWYPPKVSTYVIEVRNFGPSTNGFTIVIR